MIIQLVIPIGLLVAYSLANSFSWCDQLKNKTFIFFIFTILPLIIYTPILDMTFSYAIYLAALLDYTYGAGKKSFWDVGFLPILLLSSSSSIFFLSPIAYLILKKNTKIENYILLLLIFLSKLFEVEYGLYIESLSALLILIKTLFCSTKEKKDEKFLFLFSLLVLNQNSIMFEHYFLHVLVFLIMVIGLLKNKNLITSNVALGVAFYMALLDSRNTLFWSVTLVFCFIPMIKINKFNTKYAEILVKFFIFINILYFLILIKYYNYSFTLVVSVILFLLASVKQHLDFVFDRNYIALIYKSIYIIFGIGYCLL